MEASLVDAAGVRRAIARGLLGGEPATARETPAVVWTDGGDEVLVHLASIAVRFTSEALVVSVDLETVETGCHPLVMTFAMGGGRDGAGLFAVTTDRPYGDAVLAERWGTALQEAVWGALTALATRVSAKRGASARGLGVKEGRLRIERGPRLVLPRSRTRQ